MSMTSYKICIQQKSINYGENKHIEKRKLVSYHNNKLTKIELNSIYFFYYTIHKKCIKFYRGINTYWNEKLTTTFYLKFNIELEREREHGAVPSTEYSRRTDRGWLPFP